MFTKYLEKIKVISHNIKNIFFIILFFNQNKFQFVDNFS